MLFLSYISTREYIKGMAGLSGGSVLSLGPNEFSSKSDRRVTVNRDCFAGATCRMPLAA